MSCSSSGYFIFSIAVITLTLNGRHCRNSTALKHSIQVPRINISQVTLLTEVYTSRMIDHNSTGDMNLVSEAALILSIEILKMELMQPYFGSLVA